MNEKDYIEILEQRLDTYDAELSAMQKKLRYYIRLLQGSALRDLLQGNLPEEDRIAPFLKQYDIEFESNSFLVALMQPDSEHYLNRRHLDRSYETLHDMGEIVETVCAKHLSSYSTTIKMRFAFIIPIPDNVSSRNQAHRSSQIIDRYKTILARILSELTEQYDIPCKASLSFPVKGIRWLFWAYDHAQMLLENLIHSEYDTNPTLISSDMEYTLSEKKLFSFERSFYASCISHKNIQACRTLLRCFSDTATMENFSLDYNIMQARRYLSFHLNTMNVDLYEPHSDLDYSLIQCYVNLSACNSMEDVLQVLNNYTDCVSDYINRGIFVEDSKNSAYLAKAYIDAHYAEPNLTVEAICARLQVSRTGLSRIFKKTFQMTLLEYIHHRRLEQAKVMIKEGLPLEDVALDCGYYSRRSMTEVFKKYESITPSEYRNQQP